MDTFIKTGREAEGKNKMVPASSSTNENAVMYQVPYYTEKDRGSVPEYVNEFNVASWEPWLTYYAVRLSSDINAKGIPVKIVHSEAAAIPQGAHQFYDALSVNKSELWLDDVQQFNFYDQDEPVKQAADAVAAFFEG